MKQRKRSAMKAIALLSATVMIAGMPIAAQAATWQQDMSGNWQLIDDSGLALKGWQTMNGETYYLDDMGNMLTGFQNIGGSTYYFNEDGTMARNWWYKDDGYVIHNVPWYYFTSSGEMARGWQLVDGRVYYFGAVDKSGNDTGATVTVSGVPLELMSTMNGVASMVFNHDYGDLAEIHCSDMTCSESEFWYQLKNATGASDEVVNAMVALVPGKWYQQADRCAAVLWNQGYDKASAYQAMINRGFTEDQATWACCMKWPEIDENGLWKNENGEYVTCEELTDSHRYDINENIDTARSHDSSADVYYNDGMYSYTMTAVNAYRENSNVSENPGLTAADYNYFQDVAKPGEDPGNAWLGDVPPTMIPDDPNAAVVKNAYDEDGNLVKSPSDYYDSLDENGNVIQSEDSQSFVSEAYQTSENTWHEVLTPSEKESDQISGDLPNASTKSPKEQMEEAGIEVEGAGYDSASMPLPYTTGA